MKSIDIEKALRQKYKGYLPRFVFPILERIVHQDELNEMLKFQKEVGGVEFAGKILDYLDIQVEGVGLHRLPPLQERCIIVSNHPLGGVDGIALTGALGKHYQGKIKMPVNDLLLNVEQFSDVFIPVNKYGRQGRKRHQLLDEALQSDDQIITFPAGFCSRYDDHGNIRDRVWAPSFVRWARKYDRTIVPLFFEATNSERFYRIAKMRERLKIKFNYELVLLPDEMIRAKHSSFRFIVGEPIPQSALPAMPSGDPVFAQQVRDALYTYPDKYNE